MKRQDTRLSSAVADRIVAIRSEEPPNKGALAQVQLALPQEKGTVEGLLRVMRGRPVQDGYEIGTQLSPVRPAT